MQIVRNRLMYVIFRLCRYNIIFCCGSRKVRPSVIVERTNTHFYNANKPFNEYNQTRKKTLTVHRSSTSPVNSRAEYNLKYTLNSREEKVYYFHFLYLAAGVCTPDVRCREHGGGHKDYIMLYTC